MLKETFDYNNGGSFLTIFPLLLDVSNRTYSGTCNTKPFPQYHNFHIHVYYGTGLSWHISLTHSNVTPQNKDWNHESWILWTFLKVRRKLDEDSSSFETSKQKLSLLLAPITEEISLSHSLFLSLPHISPLVPSVLLVYHLGGRGRRWHNIFPLKLIISIDLSKLQLYSLLYSSFPSL